MRERSFHGPAPGGAGRYGRRAGPALALSLALACASAALRAQTEPAAGARKPAPAGHSQALKAKASVTLNFVNADIEAVSRAMGAMLDRQLIVDPRVKGTITLYSEQPLSVREAYLNYLAALRGLGFTVVDAAGLLKVVPEAEAKLQAGTVTIDNAARQRGDQVLTQIFRLNHENANNLVPVLRPLISPNNTINANPGNNTLVITDYADNLQRLARIIAAMDMPSSGDIEVIALEHVVASDIAPVVQRMVEGGGTPGPAGAANAPTVLADARSNALIVRAANPVRMASVRAMVAKLDRPAPNNGAAGNIYVVYLKNADAAKLAQVLRAAFGGAAGASATTPSSQSAASPGTTGAVGAAGAAGSGSVASPQATAPVSPSASPSTGGFVQADPATNSLIITAAEPLYRQMRAVIDQLDSRRAQIFIESMIVEMDAAQAADFGFQWQGLLGGSSGNRLVAGTNFGSGGNNIVDLAIDAPDGTVRPNVGLNIGLVRSFAGITTLAALARFLETKTGANILSTPNLVALDNEEAKFVNGQNVPFITGQFTSTGSSTGTVNPFQTIERRDVGLTLRVRPQVGEGGKVRMTVFQENSSVVQGTTAGTAAGSAGPTTNKSSIETTVEVADGQIMVLGGLLKDEYSNTDDKVPLLGDVPLLGNLFRSESRTRRKTNLMVFLRPVVMRTAQESEQLTLDRYESIRALQQRAQPEPSRVLGINEAPILPPASAGAKVPQPPTPAEPVAPAASAVPAAPQGEAPAPSPQGETPAAPAPGAVPAPVN